MPNIMQLIKSFVLEKPKLYVLLRSIHEINNINMYKLLAGYYEKGTNVKMISLILENTNNFMTTSPVYDISFGEFEYCDMGFCALLFWTLWHIYFADKLGFIPMVTWGNNCKYHDREMSDTTDNVFEYYFCPTFSNPDVKKETVRKNYTICQANRRIIINMGIKKDSYFEKDQEGLLIHAQIYKKYIHLNPETHKYLKTELSKLFKKGKTLGVHVRGTDFKKGFKNHPIAISFDEYLIRAKEIYYSGNYDYIFLATDDCEALELFKKEFENNLIFYLDTFRTIGDDGAHSVNNMRSLHHYKLGLEVLRDVYTLAYCNGLICSLSNVSFAARYISLSLDRKYEDLVILDNGIAKTDSKFAKKIKKQTRKKEKKTQRYELHQNA